MCVYRETSYILIMLNNHVIICFEMGSLQLLCAGVAIVQKSVVKLKFEDNYAMYNWVYLE